MSFEYLLDVLLFVFLLGLSTGVSHFVLIFIHEMGHAIGCLLMGVKIYEFYISSKGIIGDYGIMLRLFGVTFLFSNYDDTADGHVVHAAVDDYWSRLVIVSLGPIFSFIAVIVLMLSYVYMTINLTSDYVNYAFLVALIAPALTNSWFLFLMPIINGSDGEKIRDLLSEIG